MFATGPRAVGFTIVWPEGVIFRSMMTYHVAIPTARSSWLGQPPAAGCDRLPARGEPCAPSRASGQASQSLGRRPAQARGQGPGFGPRGAGPDCVRCHTRYASALVPPPHRSQVRWQQEPESRPTSDGEGAPGMVELRQQLQRAGIGGFTRDSLGSPSFPDFTTACTRGS